MTFTCFSWGVQLIWVIINTRNENSMTVLIDWSVHGDNDGRGERSF